MDALDCYIDNPFGWLNCGLSQLTAAVGGEGLFGLLIGGVTIMSFYIASGGNLATASTLTVLIGGLLVAALPASYQAIAITIMFIGLVGAVLRGLETFVFSG
jgi:hypothetical protein